MISRYAVASKMLFVLLLSLSLAACQKVEKQGEPFPSVPTAQTPAKPLVAGLPDFTQLVKKEGPAVVNISTTIEQPSRDALPPMHPMPGLPDEEDPFFDFFRRFMDPEGGGPRGPAQSLGSGFIISPDGYILTNAHVVQDASEITVRMTDKREFKAKVVGSDPLTDIALLKVDASKLPVVDLGNPRQLQVGEWVAAIGSPFGFENSVTAGIVSALGRELPTENYVPFIQTDVAVNPGNSGGPLFNLQGQVVGINSQIYSQTGGYMGLSFAIPIDVALEVAKQLREHGKVTRGRLGVAIQDMNEELAKSFGLASASGALIASVERNGPADRAGLMVGDVILKYNGEPIDGASELPRLVAATKPGSRATLQIWRKGRTQQVGVVVGELTAPARGAAAPGPARGNNALGLVLRELSPVQQEQLGVKGGLLVEQVSGQAAAAGITPGDVITAVNNDPVQSVEQFNRLVSRYKAGQTFALLVNRRGNALYVPMTAGAE
ncbi:MAG: DegQ family serine endoprotease [Pseudomonadota bacterium]